jgi:hypothetical protein
MTDAHELSRDAPPEADDRPWERPGAVRRDCKPHRGEFLRSLGMFSMVWGILAVCTPWAAPVPWLTGIPVWIMASRDLAAMRAGLKDPNGRVLTLAGRSFAIAGISLSLLGATCWGLLSACLWRWGVWSSNHP